MTDIAAFGESPLWLAPPDGERIETATDLRFRAAGTESAVAVVASRLGTESAWLSRVPDTPLGRRVVAGLRQHGVETAVDWTDDGRQGLVFREAASPPRAGLSVQDRWGTPMASASPDDVDLEIAREAEVAVVGAGTVALSESSAAAARAFLEAADQGGARTAMVLDVDPGLWDPTEQTERVSAVLEEAGLLFVTASAAEAVLDRSGRPRELVHTVAADGGFELVVLRHGDGAATVWDDNVIHEREGVAAEAGDAAGVHGAFVGGFLDRLVGGSATDEALDYGVASAALARSVAGPAATVDPAEVERVAGELP